MSIIKNRIDSSIIQKWISSLKEKRFLITFLCTIVIMTIILTSLTNFLEYNESRQGFSFDNEEHDVGINAIGAPIFNSDRQPVASIVVAGPSQRITWDSDSSFVSLLKETAAEISAQLYYQ